MSETNDDPTPPEPANAREPENAPENTPERTSPAKIFRSEAFEYHHSARNEAHLLRLIPTWTRRAYWVLVAVCSFALLYVAIGRVNEYAGGTAVIQSEGRIDVTAHVSGTVETLTVRPGKRVEAGDMLVRLHADNETADLERIDKEIELHLVSALRDPGDTAARGALASLRAQRDLAKARLEERTLRAPHSGVVSDVRIRPGQRLDPGDLVVSLIRQDAPFRVLAVLPGQYRPLLRPGMMLRLELAGFAYAYQTAPITAVSEEVVGPAEVRRYLPPAIADAFAPEGPMVIVEAELVQRSFVVSGRSLDFYDGMVARAEIAVRSESILITLIPGLRTLMGDHEQAD